MRASRPSILVLGLGNRILRDDAVGLEVARRVRGRLAGSRGGHPPGVGDRMRPEAVEVVEAEVGGFALLDLLTGRRAAILVDALEAPHHAPGTVLTLPPEQFHRPSHLATSHQIDLPTALSLGPVLGLPMPSAVRVVAVVVEDTRTFGERLSPAVAKGAERAVNAVLRLLANLA